MRDSDIDVLSADGAQGSSKSYKKAVTDSRTALAEVITLPDSATPEYVNGFRDGWQRSTERLAERGVLLVTEERLREAADRIGLNFWQPVIVATGAPYKEMVFDYGAWAAAILAALSGEQE